MRIWYIGSGELRHDEFEASPQVGELLHGREITRIWPDAPEPFHRFRILFEAGVIGVSNLEERARECGLWEPSETVTAYIKALGFELDHVPGATAAHQMLFRVSTANVPMNPGEGVFPFEALVDFARNNRIAPPPQAAGTVVPMPAIRTREDGTVVGPGVAISKRLQEFIEDPHNRMLPKDWCACLLNFAAYYAIAGGCTWDGFEDLAGRTYARVAQDRRPG